MTIAHKLNGTVARHSKLILPVYIFYTICMPPMSNTFPHEKVLAKFQIMRQKENQHLIDLFREASTKTLRIRIS